MKLFFLLLVILSLSQYLLMEGGEGPWKQMAGAISAISRETADPPAENKPSENGQQSELGEPAPIPTPIASAEKSPSPKPAAPPGVGQIAAKAGKAPVQEKDMPTENTRPANPRLNLLTRNLNILFVGAHQQDLLAVAVYSVNYPDRYQSAAIFIPTDAFFPPERPMPGRPNKKARSLETIFQAEGPQGLAAAISEALSVELDYYISIDQRVLQEVEKFIDPIVVNEQKVELENLFTMEITPADEIIMGALLAELTRPEVFFAHLPRLVLTFRHYLETDFAINPENLWLHYKIARGVDTSAIPKIFAPTVPAPWQGQTARVVPEEWLGSALYRLTRNQMAQVN